MDIHPFNEIARQTLVETLFSVDKSNLLDKKNTVYVARTFPSILLDIAKLLVDQTTKAARESSDQSVAVRQQLKPYLLFNLLLGKCPQITSLIYNYFETSSFQPLPENLFTYDDSQKQVVYNYPEFNDELLRDILTSYIKYLSFNQKYFAAIWNWSELGRLVTEHNNPDIRHLSACCLSIITKPTRLQHLSFLQSVTDDYDLMVELQIKHRSIYSNTFRPCIQTKQEMAIEYAKSFGPTDNEYSYCQNSLTKVANILLLKRVVTSSLSEKDRNKCAEVISLFVPVQKIHDSISKIAYAISIGKPCLLRGSTGSGKTAILDYIAANTHRIQPPDYVKVQIGDQIDSKLLIGSYVCTDIPGQFEWQPGPLVKAMTYGSWIVFEDIDTAPSELAQVIHSVIENGNLSCVACCPVKLDHPHPDFRIIFTQRQSATQDSDLLRMGFGFVERLCDIVEVPELEDEDFQAVLASKYLEFASLNSTILRIFNSAKQSMSDSMNRRCRPITLRDLLKLCDRLKARKLHCASESINVQILESLYLDSVECLIGSLPLDEITLPAQAIGEILNLPSAAINRLFIQRKPEIREAGDFIDIGRVRISITPSKEASLKRRATIAYTTQTLQLLESMACCVNQREPVLLVGETGVGKTSLVQHLANLADNQLVVINLSQQSDSSDLLGNYKPIDIRKAVEPLNERFERLFEQTLDMSSNENFLRHVNTCFATARTNHNWLVYLKLVSKICDRVFAMRLASSSKMASWRSLNEKATRLARMVSSEAESAMILSYSEGALIDAVKTGKWILLDEVNLAEPEVLQCLMTILDSSKKTSLHMNTPGDPHDSIRLHQNFRMFACMNPSTDVGKRDLPLGTRQRFTEFFVNETIDKFELRLIVENYVKSSLSSIQIDKIVDFYRELVFRSSVLSDISGNTPIFSLRTLCRALSISSANICNNTEKTLFESIKVTFLQQLNNSSVFQLMKLVEQFLFDPKKLASLESLKMQEPKYNSHNYVEIEGFYIEKSNQEPKIDENYILTESIRSNLKKLVRIIALGQRRLPILIQGNTSVGKTSLILQLAQMTGNKCYRINNHEHTDLQEYVGRYVLGENGELRFQEGLLARAMRKGYWVILDELNLAPGELLEALNRVLDDNRELFIPETGQTVKAHSKFMLFATQNPPEEYAGRKLLSRAFRNRFIELHFDEIPGDELEQILHKRCKMAPQHANKVVSVMKELQTFRRESGCFSGKNGFMTLRDMFRWGNRYLISSDTVRQQFFDWDQHIATEGLILLEGRVRTVNEAEIVKKIIEKVFKCELDRHKIYHETVFKPVSGFHHIHLTEEFRRMYVQLTRALKYQEPVLLCGQTGCGKTTACQLYAVARSQPIIIYNCHQNTESSDFVGGVRPCRNEDSSGKQTFPWVDGPLVEAMKSGSIFLMDEISLADDAVLERINSTLEPSRSITLTEKDGKEAVANTNFRFIATMNPGGDYGKKELSPALRNRFTEIYCHNVTDMRHIRKIIENSLALQILKPRIAPDLLHLMQRFLTEYYKVRDIISIRDVLSWVQFINVSTNIAKPCPLSIQEAIVNGASLVFFDQFGTDGHKSVTPGKDYELRDSLKALLRSMVIERFSSEPVYTGDVTISRHFDQDVVKFKKFFVPKGPLPILEDTHHRFVLDALSVKKNMMRIVRAMQLDRPILLEGDPGVGKTSAVSALARLTGHKLVRINLSEQTDISDLFGSDLPSSDGIDANSSPKFSWHDGPMLRAINQSHWILLDEMNLASQSVLEGLNAFFDHRGEIFISELNKKFKVDRSTTRVFACQNPYSQGAARKGLPQSFLNRFTSIYIEHLSKEDMIVIISSTYPQLPGKLVDNMVTFNNRVNDICGKSLYEFNLRDLLHWSDLMTRYVHTKHAEIEKHDVDLYRPDKAVQFVYLDRLRDLKQRAHITQLFEQIFGPVYEPPYRELQVGEHSLVIARSRLMRQTRLPPHLSDLCILKYQMPYLESIAKAIEFAKMPIIVGECGVGKRSMVKILAGITGNELQIVGANKDMDTFELLGSYEQKSVERDIVDLIEDSKECVMSILKSMSQKKYQSKSWAKFFHHTWLALYATYIRDLKLSKTDLQNAYQLQLSSMRSIIERIEPLADTKLQEQSRFLLRKIDVINQKLAYDETGLFSSGSFEWIDSVLVRSVREGKWLLIENANLMNPATLDRLNSLVEPNGTLSLNEKGTEKDGIETLRPHTNFRLILTMDPEHGELSRAMRNRGVEISVHPKFYFEDFLILLNQNGFEPEEGKACMAYCIMNSSCDAHLEITGDKPEEDGSLLAYFGLNYLTTLTHQVRRGMNVDEILLGLLLGYYSQKGYSATCQKDTTREYIYDRLREHRGRYEVKLIDQRYKWMHLRHDLSALTGGDAFPTMLIRDNQIFYEDLDIEAIMSNDGLIENIDIVNTCTAVKVFLELSSHGDFDYRRSYIRETFMNFPAMMDIVNNLVDTLHRECIPLISTSAMRSDLTPVKDIAIDTRNTPDTHFFLESLDYAVTLKQRNLQNRWILSLHRITLQMIVALIEDRTMTQVDGCQPISLYSLSQQFKDGSMMREDLLRPCIEIIMDIHDLLTDLVQVLSNQCFDNETTEKIMPRMFWFSYLICKLKRGYSNKHEMVGVCNQLPMLWILTYQKVVQPTVIDCDIANMSFNGKKFSTRINTICNFFDITTERQSKAEKTFYRTILNMYARTTKRCESLTRDVDRYFALMLGRYTSRSHSRAQGLSEVDTLAASCLAWSNSAFMIPMFDIMDKTLEIEKVGLDPESSYQAKHEAEKLHQIAEASFSERHKAFADYDSSMKDHRDTYKAKCHNTNRRRTALDQFAPIWQLQFISKYFSSLHPDTVSLNPIKLERRLQRVISNINGLIVSPRYYFTIRKYISALDSHQDLIKVSPEENDTNPPKKTYTSVDIYSAYLVDQLTENIILDNQVVGWVKLRVNTTDLDSFAPLIPEYAPILSLVGGYSLDLAHLKLNSQLSDSAQLHSMLSYLWRQYTNIKLDTDRDVQDIQLAKNLIHLRIQTYPSDKILGSSQSCREYNEEKCQCIDRYISSRSKSMNFESTLELISKTCDPNEAEAFSKALRLIYFGKYYYNEYIPIFSIDPSLRSREKYEVYKSEVVHIKFDLYLRNTLYYFRTGENLELIDIDPEDAALYPFSTELLIRRRKKLEQSLARLAREQINRPKTDDGSLYYELRRDVMSSRDHCNNALDSLVQSFVKFLSNQSSPDSMKYFDTLNARCRTLAKSFEKSITRFRSDYTLYGDLLTSYLVGLVLAHQGLRCLYSKLEQKMQIREMGFSCSVQKHLENINRIFSFNNFSQDALESINHKLTFVSTINQLCPNDQARDMHSMLLKTILIQLNHHITITPSDIMVCIPIVHRVADLFHVAWLDRKVMQEEQKRKREELYEFKTTRSTLGCEVSLEREEFIEICTNFPTYDHIFRDYCSVDASLAERENIDTEAKVTQLNRYTDLAICIDICKAHYKFMKQASRSLIGQHDSTEPDQPVSIDLDPMIELEAQTLYTTIRHCIGTLDRSFDSRSVECHILQVNHLNNTIDGRELPTNVELGSLKSSIGILDEQVFDIYHHPNAREALKLQDFINRLDAKASELRNMQGRDYDKHPTLVDLVDLISRVSMFLLKDPMMKFVTGSHSILQKLEEWNRAAIPRDDKFSSEADELVELIKSWRSIEIMAWRNSLHRVKRNYIDGALCDLWFDLYNAFRDPIRCVRNLILARYDIELDESNLYPGFALLIKEFIESSTLGDYQIRLDLVFAFSIQTRFAGLGQSTSFKASSRSTRQGLTVDYVKLTTFVYNIYSQYVGRLEPLKNRLEQEESKLTKELNTEIRIVSWQGRNLWEMKNNFRISHRKLNKVMRKYLEVLRKPAPYVKPKPYARDDELILHLFSSEQLSLTMSSMKTVVDEITCRSTPEAYDLSSLRKAQRVFAKFKDVFNQHCDIISSKYIENCIIPIESSKDSINSLIESFHNHKVEDVIIQPNDTREVKEAKIKTCRQMLHGKRYSVQNIFKTLHEMGISYRRGLNCVDLLDDSIATSEPLRGMVQSQSRLVLEAASKLVEDKAIIAYNGRYRELVTNNMYLLAQERHADLPIDHDERIRGCALDMVLNISRHNTSASHIYEHLMNIQAATSRLKQLSEIDSSCGKLAVYNFKSVHEVVKYFNDLVGRSFLGIAKLEKLSQCCSDAMRLEARIDQDRPNWSQMYADERAILHELIKEAPSDAAIMTDLQFRHFGQYVQQTLKTILEVSGELRDMLRRTPQSYLYGDDDLGHLKELYDKFSDSFERLLSFEDESSANLQKGTALGALKEILHDCETKLFSQLQSISESSLIVNLKDTRNAEKLDLRLNKLIHESMLALQEAVKKVEKFRDTHGEVNKRRCMKPFNYVNSNLIEKSLRLDQVSKSIGNVFMTLNKSITTINIQPLVTTIGPILFIYVQDVASYLNIILASSYLEVSMANQLLTFFTSLVLDGFGLPTKMLNDGCDGTQPGTMDQAPTASGDNTGFGEGQGDTDVSKRLEFESQLDDLKKDEDQEDQEVSPEDQKIDAHDDGVEITDDINAKAEGPDDKPIGDEDQSIGDEDDESENAEAELDKTMDTVDQEEERLDENLWGDEPEPKLGEDDEDDLRQAEPDVKSNEKTGSDKEMSAKAAEIGIKSADDDNEESSEIPKNDQNEPTSPEAHHQENVQPELDQDNVDLEKKNGDENENDDQQLDLDSENDLAKREAEQQNSSEGPKEGDDIDERMSISDDGKEQDAKSEGELSSVTDSEENEKQESCINDEDLDDRLEGAVIEEELSEVISRGITNLMAQNENQQDLGTGTETGGRCLPGRKENLNTVYDVYDDRMNQLNDTQIEKELDDPLDFAEQLPKPKENLNESTPSHPELGESDHPEMKGTSATNEPTKSGLDAPQDNRAEEDTSPMSKKAKRSLADHDYTCELKRQKIEEGDDKSLNDSNQEQNQENAASIDGRVRHAPLGSNSDAKVIDIASEEDQHKLKDVSLPKETSDDQDGQNETEQTDPTTSNQQIALSPMKSIQPRPDIPVTDVDQERDSSEIDREYPPEDLSSISSFDKGDLCVADLTVGADESSNETVQGQSDDTRALRELNSVYNTNLGLLKYSSPADQHVDDQARKKRSDRLIEKIDEELKRQEPSDTKATNQDMPETDRLVNLWLECSKRTQHLVHELCQQLQIVMQPTKMSKYKGDYKTGKRLNMRKVVSYIASHYRKDKIWLRRLKPSKRTYNISIAVDNSSSMSENNCRLMTYQSLALLAKSLSLIEAGSLSVVSFGHQVRCIHEFGRPYSDSNGARWLRDIRFDEKRTSYSQLLTHSAQLFKKQASSATSSVSSLSQVSQLLIIISDGRNISADESDIKLLLNQLKEQRVLTLFIIIDDLQLNQGSSIVDIRRAVAQVDSSAGVKQPPLAHQFKMFNYMELFPFPFYVILRKLDSMPSILGDALRQWFELVNSGI